MAFMVTLGLVASLGCALGKTTIYYYPVIIMGEWDVLRLLTLISYSILLFTPLVIDILGEKKWQAYESEI